MTKKRINFDLSKRHVKLLEELQTMFEDVSFAEVLRRSIELTHEIGRAVLEGGELMLHRPDGSLTEIIIVPLSNVGKAKRRRIVDASGKEYVPPKFEMLKEGEIKHELPLHLVPPSVSIGDLTLEDEDDNR